VSSAQQQSPDLAVVGGGVIGLAVAWRAAERGLRTVVLERGGIGSGASGVAAGMLAPSSEAAFGEQPLLALNLESARRWPAFATELADRDVAFTMVAADADLVEVTGALFSQDTGPAYLVDSSTVSAQTSDRIRQAAALRGTTLLAAPVSGNAKVVRAAYPAQRSWSSSTARSSVRSSPGTRRRRWCTST